MIIDSNKNKDQAKSSLFENNLRLTQESLKIMDFSSEYSFYVDLTQEHSHEKENPLHYFPLLSFIKLKKPIDLPKGNYYHTVKDNYYISHNSGGEFFYRNYGDENLEQVNKVWWERNKIMDESHVNLSQHSNSEKYIESLSDDIVTNWIILKLTYKIYEEDINRSLDYSNRVRKYYMEILYYYPDLDFNRFNFYLKKLIDRHRNLPHLFWHLSCIKGHEDPQDNDKNFNKISITFKSFYCAICFVYDCKKHFIKEEEFGNFDNPESYDQMVYSRSLKDFLESINLEGREDCKFQIDSKMSSLTAMYKNKGKAAKQCLNRSLKIGELLANPCSGNCYILPRKSFSKILSSNYTRTFEIYFLKLFKIFKYDPCQICGYLNSIKTDVEEFECSYIAEKLLSIDFTKTLQKFVFVSKTSKKCKTSKINKKRLENIKKSNMENLKNYLPCLHQGNETCDSNCNCFERGFCEKYCVCNKDLCKIIFNYCKCKGPCVSSICPCYARGSECDPEKCCNCTSSPSTKEKFYTEENTCWNRSCRMKITKRTALGISKVAGWGLFALEDIKKDQLIQEYIGELIDEEESNIRHLWNKIEKLTYLFLLNEEVSKNKKNNKKVLTGIITILTIIKYNYNISPII
jgi:hypothetical protein